MFRGGRAVWSLVILPGLALTASVFGQQPAGEPPTELEILVREGRTEALAARLAGDQGPGAQHLLAQAHANRGRQATRPEDRRAAFAAAHQHYRQWLGLLEPPARRGELADVVRLAAARVEYAGMVLAAEAAPRLDEWEIWAGRRGDRAELTRLLDIAREQSTAALAETEELFRHLDRQEEELLATGLYDTLLQSRLDATLHAGWAGYHLGVLEDKDTTARQERLATAERRFQTVIDGGPLGLTRAYSHLGRGMAQRELGRYDEAEKSLGYALDGGVPAAVEAQVRYELARTQLRAKRFDEARTTLKPLVEKDPDHLPPDEEPGRFYVNLAHLWFANSYLVQSEALRAAVGRGAAEANAAAQVRRLRDTGLSKLQRLAQRGGPWPALVRQYVGTSVDPRTPIAELTPVELLYSAAVLIERKQYGEALPRLEAAAKGAPEAELAGDVLFELGRCCYLLDRERAAAETFSRLAADYRGHPQAPQAAGFAYALWGRVAEASGDPADYHRLALALRNLLENFADHPKRDEAAWLLPAALQRAGRFDEAAEAFGTLPAGSPHWEEAQFRRALCLARAAEAAAGLPDDERRGRLRRATEALIRYADEARQRAAGSPRAADTLKWAAEADVAAAELLASPSVDDPRAALAGVESFESHYPGSGLMGRVLAVRIRAHRALRQFEEAARMLSGFLDAAPPEQIGPTLAGLAAGMQQEVQHLLDSGQADAARALAADALVTFGELEKWTRADAGRAHALDAVLAGRARMLYHAGQLAAAERVAAELLERNPRQGDYRHLHALILTAQTEINDSKAAIEKAVEAWTQLLADPGLRRQAPQRYWEARYHWLALLLREGRAADVEAAITQEHIWQPGLGGPPWADKFADLLRAARVAQGKPPETQPTP